MNEGEFASRLGLMGIPREAETVMLERDIRLVRLTGARYHAAMISCADSVEIVRRAKQDGLPVTCGVSINNLVLNENDIGHYRTFCRLSPPLRDEADRQAVVRRPRRGRDRRGRLRPQSRRTSRPSACPSPRRPTARSGRDAARRRAAPRAYRRPGAADASSPRSPSNPARILGRAGRTARGRRAGRPRADRSRSALRPRQAPAEIALQELALRRGAAAGRRRADAGRRPHRARGPTISRRPRDAPPDLADPGRARRPRRSATLLGSIPFGLILTRFAGPRRRAGDRLGQYRRDQRAAHRPQGARRRDPAGRRPEGHRGGADRPEPGRGAGARRRPRRLPRPPLPGLARVQGRQGRRDLHRRAARLQPAGARHLRGDLARTRLRAQILVPGGARGLGRRRRSPCGRSARRPQAWLFLVMGVLLWWKHAPNIRRLASGTEGRIGQKG